MISESLKNRIGKPAHCPLPGETKTVKFAVTPRELAYWDEFEHRFRTDAGDYEILVGASSADIRGKATVRVNRDQVFAD